MNNPTEPTSRLSRAIRVLAWTSLAASFPVWFATFLVAPFLPISPARRALLAAIFFIAGEILFWGASLVLGASVIARIRPPKVNTGRSFRGLRVAVIGATGGLGEAIARAIVREGGAVSLLGRDRSRLERLARELGGGYHVVDLLDPGSLVAAAASIGRVDHVVSAAGIDHRGPLARRSDQEVAEQVAVDLLGPIHLARAFLPHLSGGGRLALLGGFGDGGLALPYHSVNVAARAGLAGFCAALNQELALEGRAERLCYVSPAPADTPRERPYAPLWNAMGLTPVPPARVASFVLVALLMGKTVAVMGFATRLFTRLRRIWPWLADTLVVRRHGQRLRQQLAPEPAPPPG
jgi:NADP-dependent 3-hydroxy acid dehydrogenase YdfG